MHQNSNLEGHTHTHNIYIVAYLLNVRTVKPPETAAARKRIVKQDRCWATYWLQAQSSNWEAVFSLRSVL
jgi:hypothetical protein